MELPNRKSNRLRTHDYSSAGSYFITICVKERKQILSEIICDRENKLKIKLLSCGVVADKYIKRLDEFYDDVCVDEYIIMPDHIHLLVTVLSGQSGMPVPTASELERDNKNSVIARFVSTFKRFCNKEYGENVWQSRYYDHVIRNQDDYNEKSEYIKNNAYKWQNINMT